MAEIEKSRASETSEGTIPESAPPLNSIKTVAPAVIDLLSTTAVIAFDGAVLGRFSSAALASGGLGFNILLFLFTIFLTFVMGASIPICRHLGAGERDKADKIFAVALVSVALLGIAFAIISFFSSPFLFDKVVGATGEVKRNAISYFRTLSFFMPIIALNFVGTGILRASGETIGAMIANLVANISFAILDISFVFGIPALGISPHGATGSALAIGIGQSLGLLVFLAYSMRGNSLVRLKLLNVRQFNLADSMRIIKTGYPSTLELFFWMFGQIVLLAYLARLGESVLAAHQILIRLTQTLGVIYQGFAFGNMALCGHRLGAGDNHAASRISRNIRYFSFLAGSIIALSLLILKKQVVLIFTNDPEVVYWAAMIIPILAVQQLLKSQTMITSSELRARGDLPFIAKIGGLFVLLNEILIAGFAVFSLGFGLPAVWTILVIDEAERLLVHLSRLSKRIVIDV